MKLDSKPHMDGTSPSCMIHKPVGQHKAGIFVMLPAGGNPAMTSQDGELPKKTCLEGGEVNMGLLK